MSLCQLIHQEIQKITGLQVDPENLDSREYDSLLERLPKAIAKLKRLKIVADLNSESFGQIESHWIKKGIDIKNIELKDLFSDSVEKICDTTIFYQGDLNYMEYQKLHPEAKSLPGSLKVVFGRLVAEKLPLKA